MLNEDELLKRHQAKHAPRSKLRALVIAALIGFGLIVGLPLLWFAWLVFTERTTAAELVFWIVWIASVVVA